MKTIDPRIEMVVTEAARTAREVGEIAVRAIEAAAEYGSEPADLELFLRVNLENSLDGSADIPDIAHRLTDSGIGYYVGNALAVRRMGKVNENA